MSDKIGWVDNLRAVACLMVVLIHSTTYYITAAGMPGERHWDVANLLNSACRVGVPLFFMISGYLFFGERRAEKNTCCVLASACCFTARWPWRIWHC